MGRTLYVANSNGILILSKECRTWRIVASALENIDVRCLCIDPSEGSRVYAGARDGTMYASDGAQWGKVSALNGKLYSLAGRLIDGNAYVYAGLEPVKLFLSMDKCKTWHELKSLQNIPNAKEWYSPWGPADLSSIAFGRHSMYVGIEVGGVLKSKDEGGTWKEISNGLHKDVHCLAVNYYNPKIIFAATGGGIYRTVSDGELWSDVGYNMDLKYAVAVAIHPSRPNITYIAMAMGPPGEQALLYKSEDYGESWNLMHEGLPYPMLKGVRRKVLAVNVAAPAEVYVGTSDGLVFYSADEGMKWEQIANVSGTINALACI